MTKQTWLIAISLTILAFSLRFYGFAGRAPFDWDQNRDYGQVAQIAAGKYIPLGPIAKGVGGFYLGSFYYYLLMPAYSFLHGDLRALPLTSLTLDALIPGLIFLLLSSSLGRKTTLTLALAWTFSWYLIDSSRISWNVALVPLWSLLTLSSLTKALQGRSAKQLYLLGLLFGLSWHIHVSLIPVIPLLLVFFLPSLKFRWQEWMHTAAFALIPLIPLIHYDLTHSFMNYHLARDLFTSAKSARANLTPMITMTLTKLGKISTGLIFGKFRDNLFLGIIILILAVKSCFDRRHLLKIAGLSILLTVALVIALGDYGFPEYYLSGAYLAVLTVVASFLTQLRKPVQLLLFAGFIFLNAREFTITPTPFSLEVKEQIIASLTSFQQPIDLSYNFDPGRDGGLRYLVARSQIQLDPRASTRILLTDKLNTPLYIDGELARDLTQIGNIRSAVYIVQ